MVRQYAIRVGSEYTGRTQTGFVQSLRLAEILRLGIREGSSAAAAATTTTTVAVTSCLSVLVYCLRLRAASVLLPTQRSTALRCSEMECHGLAGPHMGRQAVSTLDNMIAHARRARLTNFGTLGVR